MVQQYQILVRAWKQKMDLKHPLQYSNLISFYDISHRHGRRHGRCHGHRYQSLQVRHFQFVSLLGQIRA